MIHYGNLKPIFIIFAGFRDAFQRVWTGWTRNFLYSEPIGTAESRPMNTPWENTSFAYNTEMYCLYHWYFWSPDPISLSDTKAFCLANMSQEHLSGWKCIKKAKKDPVKHIIVQAHTPVHLLYATTTSMLYCEDMEESAFGRLCKNTRSISICGWGTCPLCSKE
jgi:hypothetical protein